MNISQQLRQVPTRGLVTCAAFTLIAVTVLAFWAAHMSGDSSQIAAMLGGSIAVPAAAASGRRSCRPAIQTRSSPSRSRDSAHR